jgi:hypothetical protein
MYPEYYELIKYPMDLDTIKSKIPEYRTVEAALYDLRMIGHNCRSFNAEGSDIASQADLFDESLESLIKVPINVYMCRQYSSISYYGFNFELSRKS